MRSKIITYMTVITSMVLIVIAGCKKERKNKLVDELVGTYIAYDTIVSSPIGCFGLFTNSYAVVVTKVGDDAIKFSKLYECSDVNAVVTGQNITILGCSPTMEPNVVRSGTTLYFNYNGGGSTSCILDGRIKAVKQ